MKNTFEEIRSQDKEFIMNTYGRFDVAFVGGKGSTLYNEKGDSYIDFGSGIGTSALGANDEKWSAAVSKQANTLAHISNLYYNPVTSELAEKLCKVTGMKNVFFGNSGAEANECAIKIARKYSFEKYGAESGRNKILTLKNSFHGRTVTTLAATGQDVFHNYFFPFTEGFIFEEANEKAIEILKNDDKICGVLMELVQGEGGVFVLDKEFVETVEKIAHEKDIVFMIDEVQTGVGRTGTFLACEQYGIKPDVVTLAKGLGGGLPIGAALCGEKTCKVLGASDHGSTFGGNTVSCAGALAVLERLLDDGVLAQVSEKGAYIRAKLTETFGDKIKEIRGLGMMLGIDFDGPTSKEIAVAGIANGVAVLTAKSAVRLLPPLTITTAEIDEGVARLKKAVDSLNK